MGLQCGLFAWSLLICLLNAGTLLILRSVDAIEVPITSSLPVIRLCGNDLPGMTSSLEHLNV